VIRARWWCCGEGSQLRYERRLSPNQARKRRCERNFPVARVGSVREWPQHTTDTKLWELSMCTQCLSCLKSKHLWFFSLRGVSRDPGTDITLRLNQTHPQILWGSMVHPISQVAQPFTHTFPISHGCSLLIVVGVSITLTQPCAFES
jgi:hypothetical protein